MQSDDTHVIPNQKYNAVLTLLNQLILPLKFDQIKNELHLTTTSDIMLIKAKHSHKYFPHDFC